MSDKKTPEEISAEDLDMAVGGAKGDAEGDLKLGEEHVKLTASGEEDNKLTSKAEQHAKLSARGEEKRKIL